MLDAVKASYAVDADRVTISGYSMARKPHSILVYQADELEFIDTGRKRNLDDSYAKSDIVFIPHHVSRL